MHYFGFRAECMTSCIQAVIISVHPHKLLQFTKWMPSCKKVPYNGPSRFHTKRRPRPSFFWYDNNTKKKLKKKRIMSPPCYVHRWAQKGWARPLLPILLFSFGMTLTQAISDLFAWRSSYNPLNDMGYIIYVMHAPEYLLNMLNERMIYLMHFHIDRTNCFITALGLTVVIRHQQV